MKALPRAPLRPALRASPSPLPQLPPRPWRSTPPVASPRLYATQPPAPRRLGREALLATVVLAGAAGAYYYDTQRKTSTSTPGGRGVQTKAGHGPTFTVKIDRIKKEWTFNRLSDQEVEAKLRANESAELIVRPGNPILRYDTNWVGSNEPCEDRFASDVIPRGEAPKEQGWLSWFSKAKIPYPDGKRDLMFFSIFDGHAGHATSHLLSKVMHPTLALSLAGLQAGYVPDHGFAQYINPMKWTYMSKSWTPENISKTIVDTFLKLDEIICQTPVRFLPLLRDQIDIKDAFPTTRQIMVAMSEPADNGSCAISAFIDAENSGLYVANTGDCRAVAGWQLPDGTWRCDVLTEDQMGENPKEVERIKSEHPGEEDTCIMRGRIQGGLQPTRAFGDAVYKWTADQYEQIKAVFEAEQEKPRKQRPHHLTPPYVTARPEMTYRHLRPESGEILRFVIMATDGLWDRITSEEATLLMASYLSHEKSSDIAKTSLPSQFPLEPPREPRPYPVEDLPGTGSRAHGSWVFEGDGNAATHLIRNSLAGGDRKLRGELLSMHGGMTRWMRDDITCTVLQFASDKDDQDALPVAK